LEVNPNTLGSDDAWQGFDDLPCKIPSLEAFNPETCAAQATTFKQNRRDAVNKMLINTPYVFLAGLSGVGKSTFVNKEFRQGRDKLYQKDQIVDWLENKTRGQTKILFIDEATLDQSDFSLFEGLFQDPAGILYQGTFYELTKQHSVIFAGNPVSYGDERKLAKLFRRHGNSLVFDPLPTAVLYEDILKPIFANTPLEPVQAELATIFLEVYRFLVTCSTTEVLISPRELQMMAELTLSYCKNHYSAIHHQAAEHFAFILSEQLVPKEFRGAFINKFKPKPLNREGDVLKNKDFLITSSRLAVYHHLKDVLQLRKDRFRHAQEWNEEQLYGGLGGIILEGEPGIGKTELLIQALHDSGYEEMTDLDKAAISLHPFYRLPVHLDEDKKTALLCKVFDEGAVVIIDEINSSPLMESLINELLMGTLNGRRPQNPGFTIIASQNPTTMAGRRVQSTALSRRLSTFKLEAYSETEMQDILLQKGLPATEIKPLLTAFKTNQNKARINHWKPEPSFRDLINLTEELIKEMNPKQMGTSIFNDINNFFCRVNETGTRPKGTAVTPVF
jgi:nucleoside-triphosphatase THEP1